MIGQNILDEDTELKRYALTPEDHKPRFNWADTLAAEPQPELQQPIQIKVEIDHKIRDFDLSRIAETIGSALTDLLLSRKETEIFTDRNKRLVSNVARGVAEELAKGSNAKGTDDTTLGTEELIRAMEKTLVKNNAHDIARSLLIRHQDELIDGHAPGENGSVLPRVKVIRRNGRGVSWAESKIEIAVRKSFLAQHEDPAPSKEIAGALTAWARSYEQDFIHIEDLQDRVQEELMRRGHFKVAAGYVLYREYRAKQRVLEGEGGSESISTDGTANAEDPNQDSLILVKREDGDSFLWDGLDLRKRIKFASLGLDLILNEDQIEQELRRSVFPEMTVPDLKKTIILNAKSLIERDADFAKFAGRILLTYIYEEVLEWDIVTDGIDRLPESHRKAFKKNLQRGIEIGRLSAELREFDLDKLAKAIDPAADLDFDYLGVQTLYDRYLIIDKRGESHRRLETPQLFWMRVSIGLFKGETEKQTERIISLYNLYKSRRFCSSTPTLFNSGTPHSQLSSCYLYKVDDSIESIMQRGIAENAYLSKWAGGLGGSWTAVRGTGSHIHGTNGESQGVIPFLKLHNDQLVAVNQGGKRRGSGCAYLETWHNDIADFLELRKNTGDDRRRTHDMNTANWVPDLFMKRLEARQPWTLFRSNETADLHDLYGRAFEERYLEYEAKVERGEMFGKKIEAIELWKQMLRILFETGHPWITFKDPCNVRSPQDHVGVIHSSNLCTEITLNTSNEETAVCNLGSVVLDSHLDANGEIDHQKLRETIRTAVRALDNVIDINFYPTDAAARANQRHRPIGLGVMGLQNCLYRRNEPFASEAAIDFNDEAMEAIAYYAYEASSDLAKERGAYSTYEGSKWHRGLLPPDTLDLLELERGEKIEVPRGGKLDWDSLREKIRSQGMRNSNVLAIAPTATISNIMGSTPCIEPAFKNLFVKSNLSGDFTVLNTYLVKDLKKLGLWNREMLNKLKSADGELEDIEEIPDELKEKYLTAFSVHYRFLIDAAARRQKWIDQSQSLNLFLAKPEIKTLSHMYRAAWRTGLKTTYYLRTLAASNIEKSTVDVSKEVRGHASSNTGGPGKTEYTEAERQACSIEAMRNGEECEACQ